MGLPHSPALQTSAGSNEGSGGARGGGAALPPAAPWGGLKALSALQLCPNKNQPEEQIDASDHKVLSNPSISDATAENTDPTYPGFLLSSKPLNSCTSSQGRWASARSHFLSWPGADL